VRRLRGSCKPGKDAHLARAAEGQGEEGGMNDQDYERRERECICEFDGGLPAERAREIADDQMRVGQQNLFDKKGAERK
jgi:hypothetical protein